MKLGVRQNNLAIEKLSHDNTQKFSREFERISRQ